MPSFEKHIGKVELIPIVEFNPWDFSAHAEQYAKEYNSASWKPYSANRIAFWQRCLLDAGIANLELTLPPSWSVSIQQLNSVNVLKKLWKIVYLWKLENEQPSNLIKVSANDVLIKEDILSRVLGGFLLSVDGENLLEPMCCCDLWNIVEWRKITQYRDLEWTTLWIGHPWCFVRYKGDYLIFSDLHENDNLPPVEQFSLKVDALEKAVEQAESKLNIFWTQLVEIINQSPFDPNI